MMTHIPTLLMTDISSCTYMFVHCFTGVCFLEENFGICWALILAVEKHKLYALEGRYSFIFTFFNNNILLRFSISNKNLILLFAVI